MDYTPHTVSVIIPVYNRQDVVEECIRSVLDQSYQLFEILLIDDGSTDSTVAVCRDLAIRDRRIKLFTSEHLGVSGARNIGLDAAAGEFIFFLDSDDIIHPQLLEMLVSEMDKHHVPMATTERKPCHQAVWATVKASFVQKTDLVQFTYCNHADALSATFGAHSPFRVMGGVMMRKAWIGSTRFRNDLFIGEDFYFSYENLIKGADAVFMKQAGYLSRYHDSNTSWQYDFNGFWTRFYRRKLVWESEESFGRNQYADHQKQAAYHCFVQCFQKSKPLSKDGRKMLAVLKSHKRDILPVLSGKTRLLCLLYLSCPPLGWLFMKLKTTLKNHRRKRARKN